MPYPPTIQQVVRPFAQRAPEPCTDRHVESLFWSIEEGRWQVTTQYAPQQPFAAPAANLDRGWQPPGKFDHAMIQEWTASLKACRHGGTVEFDQYVARE